MNRTGLEKDGSIYLTAHIQKKGKRTEILNLESLTEDDVKQLDNSEIVTGLNASEVLIKNISLTIPPRAKVEKILPFQTESLHFLENSLVVPVVHRKKKDSNADVTLFTTTPNALQNHLKNHSQDPIVVSSEALALVRYAKSNFPKTTSLLIVHLGLEKITLVQMEKNRPQKAHMIDKGLDPILKILKKHPAKKDLHIFEKPQFSHFYELVDELKQEISKTIYSFYQDTSKKEILVTGHVASAKTILPPLFQNHTLIKASKKEKEIPLLKKHAISVGLALDACSQDKHSVQFRQKEFTPKSELRKSGKRILSFFMLLLFLSFCVYGIGQKMIQKEHSALQKKIESSLTLDHAFSERDTKIVFDPTNLKNTLNSWQTVLNKEAKPFPFYFKTPKVIDLLSWIDRHPILCSEADTVQLIQLSYQLEKYPKIGATQDPYKTKASLELQIHSPLIARKFHESLLQGEGIIDNKSDISWEVNDNLYRITFYLKGGK